MHYDIAWFCLAETEVHDQFAPYIWRCLMRTEKQKYLFIVTYNILWQYTGLTSSPLPHILHAIAIRNQRFADASFFPIYYISMYFFNVNVFFTTLTMCIVTSTMLHMTLDNEDVHVHVHVTL